MQLQREREKILEYKRQVQSLVNKSKKIVQLKPRNPDYRSNKPIILRALCDYKQDQVCAVTQNAAKVFPFSMDGFLSIERAELNLGFREFRFGLSQTPTSRRAPRARSPSRSPLILTADESPFTHEEK